MTELTENSTTATAEPETPVTDATNTTTTTTTTTKDATNDDNDNKRKRESVPDKGYKCKICSDGGHWIQQCPQRNDHNKKQKKKKKTNHVPVEGVDPSQTDIEKAKEMQKLKPPHCYCNNPSRVKKVKQSKYNPTSRAIGLYFFFCSNKENDGTACRFAKPVEDEIEDQKKQKQGGAAASSFKGGAAASSFKGGAAASSSSSKRICMFYAKNKSCKKGDQCLFSHEVPHKKSSYE